MEWYNYIKALHLIFVITWFAGLFYIVRLFVYHAEAKAKSELEQRILIPQYQLMQYRLWYIITWPSAILATLFALVLLWFMPGFLLMDWMQVKLVFVVFLWLYHLKCHSIFNELQRDELRYTSNFFRLWNEGATIILFAVIFLIVLKNSINWIYGVVGIILFSILIMLGYKLYKNFREKKSS